jgi:hypothetical protein
MLLFGLPWPTVSGRATLEDAERVRHERKPSERPGAYCRNISGLLANRELIGVGRHCATVHELGAGKKGLRYSSYCGLLRGLYRRSRK